jgi:hypothetical protein
MLHMRGNHRARAASDPNLSIIPPHILLIDKNAATEGQAIDKASNTKVASSRDNADPPKSSDT